MQNVTAIDPPDDTGSDTFARFYYQALAAFPYCLQCALDDGVQCVYLEYFEDIALETPTHWRFIQLKTRDGKYGPWKLRDLLADGGSLRSLVRSHRALGPLAYTLETLLQGSVAYSDDLLCLEERSAGDFARCQARIGEALSLEGEELNDFVDRLRLSYNLPARADLERRNLALLRTTAPQLSFEEIEIVHARVVGTIVQAMVGVDTRQLYPLAAMSPADVVEERLRQRVEAKRLTRDVLRPLFGPLTHIARPLLRRLVEPSSATPTVLEQKLLAGGASLSIVDDAKSVRLNATARRLEILAAGGAEAQLDSVDETLRIRANAKRELHRDQPRPAGYMWDDLLSSLSSQASSIDPSALFGQFPDLLLGELCDLADRCVVDFGTASDAV